MIPRLVVWMVRSYVRGPGRSWLYTTLALSMLRLIRRVIGRRPVVETLNVTPGQHLTIDHLQVSHKSQIRDQKRASRLRGRRRRRSD